MNREKIYEYYNYFNIEGMQEAYHYKGNDLGAIWTEDATYFRLWAPTADQVLLNLYPSGDKTDLTDRISMNPDVMGTWVATVNGNLNGVYYTYSVTVNEETQEAVDPYAKAVGVNGKRGMILDLTSTDPEGFANEIRPTLSTPTSAVIYEVHVRDFSIDESSGINNKGKYLAFTEKGTTNSYGDKTGLDHLIDLNITHVHLLPVFDYVTVDETYFKPEQYNWGYDPLNYNTPEGSYSTDPYHGEIRIKEFKQMIQSLHENGICVIMDVVYNHTYHSLNSNFQKCVPGYYYRMTQYGDFSNASGCGNETASERPMMRKFIIDSLVHWATEYHIDGFRFDLMGIHDIKTMNEIRNALNKIKPEILIYGEGWTGGTCPLPYEMQALKANIAQMDTSIAVFSDDIRDGIKGNVFHKEDRGYINGKEGMEETIKFGITASTPHDQVDYTRVNYSWSPWAKEPTQTINYASAHDNYTLWDKIFLSTPGLGRKDRIRMNLLSAAIVLTSQGIPFFQAGEELLRSKPKNHTATEYVENSYNSPDSVNSIKWDSKTANMEIYHYYKGLIALRRTYPAFRLNTAAKIKAQLRFLPLTSPKVVGYLINNQDTEQINHCFCVILNANPDTVTVPIPYDTWRIYVSGSRSGTKVLGIFQGNTIDVEPLSAIVLSNDKSVASVAD